MVILRDGKATPQDDQASLAASGIKTLPQVAVLGKRRKPILMKWSTLSFLGLLIALLCTLSGAAQADCRLIGTYWRAVEIGGNPVTVEPNKKEPHFVLSAEGRVSGSTGCNRIVGSFEQDTPTAFVSSNGHYQNGLSTAGKCPGAGFPPGPGSHHRGANFREYSGAAGRGRQGLHAPGSPVGAAFRGAAHHALKVHPPAA